MKVKPVELIKYIQEEGLAEEIEKEITGFPEEWSLLNWEDNLRLIESKENILQTHIAETLSDFKELKKRIEEAREGIEQSGGETIKSTPTYQLFLSAMNLAEILQKIVAYLAIWWDIQNMIRDELSGLLREGRKYAYLKEKSEIALDSLKKVTESLTAVSSVLSKMPEELKKAVQSSMEEIKSYEVNTYKEVVNDLIKLHKEASGMVDLRPIEEKLNELTAQITELEERLTEKEREIEEMKSRLEAV